MPGTVTNNATLIASYTNGSPLVSIHEDFNGGVVELNLFPGVDGGIFLQTASDADELVANAVRWRNDGRLAVSAAAGRRSGVFADAQGNANQGVVAGTFSLENLCLVDGEILAFEIGERGTANASTAQGLPRCQQGRSA